MSRLDAADVKPHVRTTDVFDRFGVEHKRHGRELKTRTCPKCGDRTRRDAVSINAETGVWHCKVGGCTGDVFDLIAGYAGVDFPEAVKIAADIAGITETTTDPELERRIAERRKADEQRRLREQADRDKARAALPATWEGYDVRSVGGERYLDLRGIPSADLRSVVKYTPHGQPALPLRDLATSGIVGIQYRPTESGRKPMSVTGSQVAGSCLWGKLGDLDPDGVDVAVIVEGLADTLVAHLAFPGCAIYGAPGADQLEEITRAVAQRVADVRGWLLLVPHFDSAGIEAGTDAVRAAQRVGLKLDRDLHLVDLGEHNDLADAWRAGWRWQWPANQGATK